MTNVYENLVFKYIDRMNDLTPEDTAGKIVNEFLAEFGLIYAVQSKLPPPPLSKILSEGDTGPYCPGCGSSFKTAFYIRLKRCVQPECDNYWEN